MQSSPKVLPKQQMAKFGFNGWTLWALCITGLVMLPILTVATLALFPTENIWPHLLNTTLPRYFRTTVSLMVSVGLGAAVVGTVTAWLIARYRFVGAGWLEWALLMPLAIPAYVGAYALVDLLEYAFLQIEGYIEEIARDAITAGRVIGSAKVIKFINAR